MTGSLPRHRLGRTDAWVTPVGFGGASLGNLYRETTETEAEGAVSAAWDEGIRAFDTAPHYGLGLSERRLGAALAAYPRDEYQVSTKVGRLLVPNPNPGGQDESFAVPDDLMREWDFSRDGVRRSLESSLQRLNLDRIDTVFVHDPDVAYAGAAREGLEALAELKAEGLVTAVGVGTNDSAGLAELLDDGLIDVVMLAGRYTLLEQGALESVLEPAVAAGASVIAVAVYNSGVLAAPRPPAERNVRLPAGSGRAARASQPARRCLRTPRRDAARGCPGVPAAPSRSGGRCARNAERDAGAAERRAVPGGGARSALERARRRRPRRPAGDRRGVARGVGARGVARSGPARGRGPEAANRRSGSCGAPRRG